MLRCKDNFLGFSFPKTQVRAALSAYYIPLLSSKRNGNRVDHHEILFIIIRTYEFDVLIVFNILQCEDNNMSFSFPNTLFITFRKSAALCNLGFYWISTCSGVKITA